MSQELKSCRYRGVVTIHSYGYLLGGTKRHESIWFDRYQEAKDWADVVRRINLDRPEYQDADIRADVIDLQALRTVEHAIKYVRETYGQNIRGVVHYEDSAYWDAFVTLQQAKCAISATA